MPKPLLSVQLYSVRRQLEEDLSGTVAKIAELGFTAVEPYNFAATAKELAVALSTHGLKASRPQADMRHC